MGAKILTAEGHQVSTVGNGQAAIQALQQAVPDLVVADIFMPGRNGYEVCHYVKTDEKLKSIPVLLIIGAMEPYDEQEGKRVGADGVITKPLESSSLLSTVKDMLAASQRFAPARPKPSRKKAKDAAASAEQTEDAVEPSPQWDEGDVTEELVTPPVAPEINIPREMSQLPVGMLADVEREKASDADIAAMSPLPGSSEMPPAEPELEVSQPVDLLPDPATMPQLDIHEKTVWTAEPAEMTPEEAKLFEQPSANWGDLEQLVEQSSSQENGQASTAPSFAPIPPPPPLPAVDPAPPPMFPPESAAPAPPPWQFEPEPSGQYVESGPDPGLERPDTTFASTGTEPELESYDSLADTVAAQGPIRTYTPPPEPPAEEAPEGGAPPAYGGPVEELEAAPAERNLPQEPSIDDQVRKAVDEMLPEIIERVKQSLKS
jgi:CheY-like chemotaxis protein